MPSVNRRRQQFRRIQRYVPFTDPVATAVLTGTAVDGITEAGVRAGGSTIIITLEETTWVASGGAFDAIRQDIIDGLDSAGAEGTGWNAEVRDNLAVTAVVRTSDTVVTITLSAQAGYDITADETITVTVPATAVVVGLPIIATPTFEVTANITYTQTGSGGAVVGGSATIRAFTAVTPGISHVEVFNPNGVPQGTLTPLRYRISRYSNQVGDWECDLPVDEELDENDIPLAAHIEYGWKISITQENFSPENAPGSGHLLYQGIVEERTFPIKEGGQTHVVLKGSFRTYAVVRRSVLTNYEYNTSISAFTSLLVGDLLDPYGPIWDTGAANANISGTFNDLSKYAAWVKAATLARRVIRETWDHDRPQVIRYDGPPDSGITFRPLGADADRYAHDTGASGVALISGRPTLRWDGSNVVNRIIPVGVDTVAEGTDILTLAYATLTSPYEVKAGLNPDATLYYYIEDEDSIERYGLTEVSLNYSDVKNPNDLLGSRQQAANVLYMRAVNELIKRRSEKIEITLPPIANGAKIWALPGDSCQLEYHGEVETEAGTAIWMDLDRRMLITERHEESHPSGIRRVGYKLTAPEMEYAVPGLPGEIVLPPDDPPGDDPPGSPDPPGAETCCEDPNDEQNGGPEEEFEDTFPPPEAVYAEYGRTASSTTIAGGGEGGITWNYTIFESGSMDLIDTPPGSIAIPVPDLGPGSWTVTVRLGIRASPWWSGTRTWTVKIKSGSTVLGSASYELDPGESNQETAEGGFPFFPTFGVGFSSGEWDTVSVYLSPNITGNAIYGYGDDSKIRLSFTPA